MTPTTPMPSAHVLLQQIIDYAGLFPPASLDMPTTVRNYARDLESDHQWLLARIVIPTGRLDEFIEHAGPLLPRNEDADPWPISALTAPSDSPDLDEQLAAIIRFNEHHADASNGLAVIDAIELKGADTASMDSALDRIDDSIFPFFELNPDDSLRGLIATLAGSDAGAKIRTGGITPELYPSPKQVATFIAACAAANVPFKATAGLHHPLRHRNEIVGADEFGFLNVFIAAAFAYHEELDETLLIEILTETSLDAFRFDDEGVQWRDHRVSCEDLDDTRLAFALSFGSCSVNEPVDDLISLKLL